MIRTILKYTLLFLVFHVLLYLAFTFFLKRYSLTEKTIREMEKPATTRFLIMGNSHSIRALDTSKLKCAIQLAEFGESPEAMYYKLRKIIEDKAIHFDHVIIPFDFTPVCPFSVNLKNYKTPFYLRSISAGEYAPDKVMTYKKIKEKWLYTIFPYKEFASELEKIRESKRKYKKSYSFIPETKANQEAAEKFFWRGLRCGERPGADNTLQLHFRYKIIELCLKNKVSMIGICYPMHSSLNKVLKENSDNFFVKEQVNTIDFIQKNKIPFLDYTNFHSAHNNHLFSDYQHLNLVGQNFFTRKFLRDLDSLTRPSLPE